MDQFQWLLSSNFLEAEVRATFQREGIILNPAILAGIEWVYPDRALPRELETVSAAGCLRGADLWHLAAALDVAHDPCSMTFLTMDRQQQAVAASVGFQTIGE